MSDQITLLSLALACCTLASALVLVRAVLTLRRAQRDSSVHSHGAIADSGTNAHCLADEKHYLAE
jgi:hypothetical protein